MLKEKYPPSKLTISLDTNFDASDSWNGNGYLKNSNIMVFTNLYISDN